MNRGRWLVPVLLLAAAACGVDLGSNVAPPGPTPTPEASPPEETGAPDAEAGADADADAPVAVPTVTYVKASNTREMARFGIVAIDGDTLAVGALGDASGSNDPSDTSAPNAGAVYVFRRSGNAWSQEAYLKASNARAGSFFGVTVALAGNTLAVGAIGEASAGAPNDTSAPNAGAVYVFTRNGTTWTEQAYLKASNARENAQLGASVALVGDVLVVGASGESSAAKGPGGDKSDTSAPNAGAAYVFTRSGTTWAEQAYLKPSNTQKDGAFGSSIGFDGTTLVVGAIGEASNARGVGGNENDTSVPGAGAAYVFTGSGSAWTQRAYLKATNTHASANIVGRFGAAAAVSGDTVAISAPIEASKAKGANGDANDTSALNAGAVYIYERKNGVFTPTTYLKASNTRTLALFGFSLALAGDELAVGAIGESSGATGFDGNQGDTSAPNAGAIYTFKRTAGVWSQTHYLKATNARAEAVFGYSVARSQDTIAAGSVYETSSATGIDGNGADTSAPQAGAVYLFR